MAAIALGYGMIVITSVYCCVKLGITAQVSFDGRLNQHLDRSIPQINYRHNSQDDAINTPYIAVPDMPPPDAASFILAISTR